MRYMIIFMTNDELEAKVPAAEMEQVIKQHALVTQELKSKGRYVCCARLRPGAEANMIRFVDGRRTVSSGAAGLAGERLSGFYVVEAETREEAIEWAMKLPQLECVVTEVRPIWEML